MALTPLATSTDLPTAWQANAGADRALRVASAAIRDAAGVTISEETSTVVVTGGTENLLTLPGPVTDVATVLLDGDAVTDHETLPNGLWRRCGWGGDPVPVTVTYTHGLATIPDDIVDLVCQLAVAWMQHESEGGGSTAGLTSVKIDDAAESYSDESSGQISPVYIPDVTRQWLASRFGGGVAVVSTL